MTQVFELGKHPRSASPPGGPPGGGGSSSRDPTRPAVAKRRILVVDDEQSVRVSLKAVFETLGWVVTACADGESALAALENQRFELLFLDKNLPGISGIDVAERVRQTGNAVPIVLMTAYPTVESAMRAMPFGIDAYVVKPFDDVFEVADRARLIVERHAKEEALRQQRVANWQRRTEVNADTPVGPVLGAVREQGSAPGAGARYVIASAATADASWMAQQLQDPLREVAVVRSLDELRRTVASLSVDVVLLDLSLGDTVVPALNALRSLPSAPTVLVTGDCPSLAMVPPLIGAGAAGFLEKPYGTGEAWRQRLARLLTPFDPNRGK